MSFSGSGGISPLSAVREASEDRGIGYEFTIDKNALGDYGLDYLIAMTAAGFPWLFVAAYFFVAVGGDSNWGDQPLYHSQSEVTGGYNAGMVSGIVPQPCPLF